MSWSEHYTAVIIGQRGGFKGADFAGKRDDFVLIHAYAGAKDGDFYCVVGNAELFDGLACDLADRFAGNQC